MSRMIFKGHIFDVIQKDMEVAGRSVVRDLVIHPGGAAISLVLEGKILLVSQSRAGAGGRQLLEIPAGTIDAGEQPIVTAMRELNEETGFTAKSLSLISAFYPTPGYDTEVIHVYKAHEPEKAAKRLAMDATEDISLVWMDLQEAYAKVKDGTIQDGKTILAIQHEILAANGL